MTHETVRQDWRWLDRVVSVGEEERTLTARRRLEPREWYFAHHFPQFAVLPGVLLLEAMAHTVGVLQTLRFLRRESVLHHYVLTGARDVRFYRFARAGDELVLSAEVEQSDRDEILARVQATADGRNLARARIMLHRVDPRELTDAAPDEGGAMDDPFGARRYLLDITDAEMLVRFGLPGDAKGAALERKGDAA